MSKPIFIVRIPLSADREAVGKQMDMLEKKLIKDYYLIPVRESSVDRAEFECYNVDNAAHKDIEEIKQMVLKLNNEQ
jgi:nitrogen regulatory protein PII-like uncharacterized protein